MTRPAQRRRAPRRLRRGRILAAAVAALLAGAGVGYLLLAHRVDRPSLSYSIANSPSVDAHVRTALVASCAHSRERNWTCSLETARRGDGGIVYLMRTHGHCWAARLAANFSGFRLPGHAHGCVGILDQLRVDDLLLARLGLRPDPSGFF